MDIATGDAIWSDEFFRICGYEPGSIEPSSEIGFQIIHPDDRDRAAEAVNKAVETGRPYDIEKRIVRPDGTVRWVHSIGEITYDRQDQPKTLLGSFQDITERKQAEEALRQSQERFEDMLSLVPDMISIHDPDMNIVYSNWNGFGAVAEEKRITGTKCYNAYRGFDDVCPDCQAVRVLQTKERFQEDVELPGGTWVDLRVILLLGEDGSVELLMEWVRDITKRKRAEEARRESEERMQAVLDSTHHAFMLIDPSLKIKAFNQPAATNARHVFGETLCNGQSILNYVLPSHEDSFLEYFQQAMQGETIIVEREVQNGFWFSFAFNPISSAEREITGVCFNSTDITERKQIEKQLTQQERLAAVGQLAGGIAHDFNNLLASIILNAQMPLRQSDLTSSTRDALNTVLEESHRAADLVQQILDFSRSAILDVAPVDLVALVHKSVTLLRRTIPEHIRISTEMGLPSCMIEADATRIHQVLMNLALNARDAMPQGGDLHIQVKQASFTEHDARPWPRMSRGSWACVTVSDTGTGITEEMQDHLFEPFFTTKDPGQGTGLGLAQVYGIVKQHQGFIGVDTAVAERTTFTIYLPLAENMEELEEASAWEGRPSQGQGETILVIEDSKPLRTAIKSGLESLDYHVVSASNGYEALDTSLEGVDLVLTDMVMPKMDGDVLLQELHRQAPELKVIAMTGHVLDIDADDLRADGFTNAILKPFSIQDLTAVIREALDYSARRL